MNVQQRTKKATNVSLDPALVERARELGVNVSAASEAGLRDAVRKAWAEQNAASMQAWGDWLEENGDPLAQYRLF
ncbi:type II toxin-antitoxin system CcdA family antitoxin [Sulfitobacter sp. HNIBRBA3233]|uniref:type II toxin-antitoxin system CcdA family antitoxin n=1 Tax=Sulfitobacter marinivivus TaxID=3158558 RepID=UPI0032DF1FB9